MGACGSVSEGPQPSINRAQMLRCSVEVHNATLLRSFAKVGNMDPYCVVRKIHQGAQDAGDEILKTCPHKGGNKEPTWMAKVAIAEVPEQLCVDVWDKNNFHKDVFCGSVTIPCAAGMSTDKHAYTLKKSAQKTGEVFITIITEKAENEVEADLFVSKESEPNMDSLSGAWTCVDTWGQDNFLQASGAVMLERKIAKAAKWPSWDFTINGDEVIFMHDSIIGQIRDEFPVGKEYDWVDGKNNKWQCICSWTSTADGGKLFHERKGSQGYYTEERVVSGDELRFTLTNSKVGCSWGRTFQRG